MGLNTDHSPGRNEQARPRREREWSVVWRCVAGCFVGLAEWAL